MNQLIPLAVGAPGLALLLIGVVWLVGAKLSEAFVARLTSFVYLFSTAVFLSAFFVLGNPGPVDIEIPVAEWFRVGEYAFHLSCHIDWISLPMLTLTAILTGVIGAFSRTYMHREPGYLRFFFLLHLFGLGSLVAFAAGSIDLFVAGWELVGLSSILLIGFFCERPGPVAGAIRVFGTYRTADVGLLVGVFVIHHYRHSASLVGLHQHEMDFGPATMVGLLLLLAAMGKAAQIPFSGWLPRAMEGPTPSSAIFYGAISVHLGAYLLLRARPLLADSTVALAAVTLIGVATALHALIVGRACTDAKTSLAYASVAQLGLIFAEIGMGWSELALVHIIGHSTIRTLQFLRAPSMLREYHHMHAAAGGQLELSAPSLEAALPEDFRRRLYWFALDRGHLDWFLDRVFLRPLFAISRALLALDEAVIRSGPPPSTSSDALPQAKELNART